MTSESQAGGGGTRRALVAVVLLSLALHAPCLGWGFFLDDHSHQLVFEGQVPSPTMSWFNVFDFGYAPRPGEAMFESGGYPWWTSPDWKARFFRPLASCSMALDQKLFGRNAAMHHAVGLGIYALVLLAAHRLFRRAGFGERAALFALAIFAFEDGSALVVGWIANRNSLLEALFAVLALTAALDARASGKRGPAALALVSAVLATLAKESGLATLGVVALLLWRTHRASSILAGLLVGSHVAFLLLGDYGVRAAMYPAPWLAGGLGPFLQNLGLTLAVQPLAAISPLLVDILVSPGARYVAIAGGALITPLVARLVWRSARTEPAAGWFALWGLATLLPQSLAPASDRLVFVPTLAFAPLVGSFLAAELHRPWLRPSAAVVIAFLALPLSAFMLGLRAATTGALMDVMEQVALGAELTPLEGSPDEGDRRDVFALQYPNAIAGFGAGGAWAFETGDLSTRWFSLQMIGRGLEWTRVDERSFDLTSLGEPFCGFLFEAVFLDTPQAPAVGQRWQTSRFEVEARAVDEAGLRTVRVTWHAPLAEGEPVFLTWDGERLARIEPPPVGATRRLERAEPLLSYLP